MAKSCLLGSLHVPVIFTIHGQMPRYNCVPDDLKVQRTSPTPITIKHSFLLFGLLVLDPAARGLWRIPIVIQFLLWLYQNTCVVVRWKYKNCGFT